MTEIHHFLAARIHEDKQAGLDENPDDPAVQRWLNEAIAKEGILLDYMAKLSRWEKSPGRIGYPGCNHYEAEPDTMALRYLALPYADHPDYEPAWIPPEPGTVETWGRR